MINHDEHALYKQAGALDTIGDFFKEYPILKTLAIGAGTGLGAREIAKRKRLKRPDLWGLAGFALPGLFEYATNTGGMGNVRDYGWEGFLPQTEIDSSADFRPGRAARHIMNPDSGVTAENLLSRPQVQNRGRLDWSNMALDKQGPMGIPRRQRYQLLREKVKELYALRDRENATQGGL